MALLDSRNKHFLINLNNCTDTSCNSWHEIFIRTDSDHSEWESELEWKKKKGLPVNVATVTFIQHISEEAH